uniref:Vesicle transport protein n=1 Tax=Trypanosoma congolense (strain IL3000) TaxID=1068625 RepID=G0V206_TRYCI|nr:unnamed protein product [Trypanosoma congolense IL3000]
MSGYVSIGSVLGQTTSVPLTNLEISGLVHTDEAGAAEEDSLFPTLTLKERITGFVIVFALSILFSLMAWLAILSHSLRKYAALNTMSNIMSISGTMFLCGPVGQLKRMFDSTRWSATVVYLSSLVLTLVAAILLRSPLLTLMFMIVQYFAMLWYTLSYIPFGRSAALKLLPRVY